LVVIIAAGCKGKEENAVASSAAANMELNPILNENVENSIRGNVENYNYDNGNGGLIENKTENNKRVIIRKYEYNFEAHPK
jgi:hypothetical protein